VIINYFFIYLFFYACDAPDRMASAIPSMTGVKFLFMSTKATTRDRRKDVKSQKRGNGFAATSSE